MDAIKQAENGVILTIRVKPSSGRFSVKLREDGMTIRTRSPAEGNRANQEIVKELSKLFGKDVKILRGLKSRNKEIFVQGVSVREAERLVA